MPEPNHTAEAAREVAEFVPLPSISALDDLLQRSNLAPVVLFQHDPYCPISRRAYRELAGAPIRAAVVDVAENQDLAQRIEERTRVRHESPQVLVFRSGKVVWSASHFGIERAAVTRAVDRAAADEFQPEEVAACGRCGMAEYRVASRGWNVLVPLRWLWDQC